ncbi:MAG: cation:proton antiporter [Betaproteobacteria bacterium TMED82]|nr:MAG: cation:proton antiporter [Betaproteobacteria bacterium TMED82]|tara:strand:- start:547 stop:963 length:417 start_codon:yes stop_codon:yes gene_type:complete
MHDDLIFRVAAKLLIPFIFLISLYIQFHGDFGPGGGFQAGVLFSAGVVLYSLIFGLKKTREIFTVRFVECMSALGVLLFSGVGVLCAIYGGEFLNYSFLKSDSVAGQHIGILLVELGVFITVSSVMLLFFYTFADYKS